MSKALTPDQADAIKRELHAAREEEALERIAELHGHVTVNDPPSVNADGVHLAGCVVVVTYSTDGRRFVKTGTSAQGALADLEAWHRSNNRRKKPDRWPVAETFTAVPVESRIAGDTAETAARIERTRGRVIQLEADAHGDSSPGAPTQLVSEL